MKLNYYIKKYQEVPEIVKKSLEKYFIQYISKNKLIYDKAKFYYNLSILEKNDDDINILNKTLNAFFLGIDSILFFNDILSHFNIKASFLNYSEFKLIKEYFNNFSIVKILKFECDYSKLFILIYLENNIYKYKIFSFTNLDKNFIFTIENEDYFYKQKELLQLENKKFENSYHISYSKDVPLVKIVEIFNIYTQECLHDLWCSNAFINKIYKQDNLIFFDTSFLQYFEKTDYFNPFEINKIINFNKLDEINDIDIIISQFILDSSWLFQNIVKVFLHLISFEKRIINFNFDNFNLKKDYELIAINSSLYSFLKFFYKNENISKIIPYFQEKENYTFVKLDLEFSNESYNSEMLKEQILENRPFLNAVAHINKSRNNINSNSNLNNKKKCIDNQLVIKFTNKIPNFIISKTLSEFKNTYDFENKNQIWMNKLHIFSENFNDFFKYDFIDKYAHIILKFDELAVNNNIHFVNDNGYLFVLTMKNNIYIKRSILELLLSWQNL